MDFVISDPRVERLAQALAKETNETVDDAVTSAIRERLERVTKTRRRKATAQELRAIAKKYRCHLKGPIEDQESMLYDEKGLPK